MLEFDPEAELDENASAMEDNLDTVKSGQVTVAVRDTKLDGRQIRKDDYMGMIDGKIVNTAANLMEATTEMVKLMLDEDSEIVTIIYGKDANQKQADELEQAILAIDEDLEIEIHEGNQPVYPFLISVEQAKRFKSVKLMLKQILEAMTNVIDVTASICIVEEK